MKKQLIAVCAAAALVLGGCAGQPPAESGDRGRMFDEPAYSRIYNYCPSIMVEKDTAHIWYCSNYASGSAGDYIFHRTGKLKGGNWTWSEKDVALSPGESGEWDSANVCDPSVIRGEFRYGGTEYSYLMAYLGCRTMGNYENSFGFAVSNDANGPWIKVRTEQLCPVYDFYSLYPNGGDNLQLWGTGQPSIVSADKKGKVLLFYTQHFDPDWGQMAERWDLADLDAPTREFSQKLSAEGLMQRDGSGTDYITNADFLYDPVRKVLYTGTDVHPFGPDYPNNIPTEARVAYMDLTGEKEGAVGDTLLGDICWYDLLRLTQSLTGNKRHSNLAFFRDPYGWIPDEGKLDIAYTVSETGESEDWTLIYTWRIHRYEYIF